MKSAKTSLTAICASVLSVLLIFLWDRKFASESSGVYVLLLYIPSTAFIVISLLTGYMASRYRTKLFWPAVIVVLAASYLILFKGDISIITPLLSINLISIAAVAYIIKFSESG